MGAQKCNPVDVLLLLFIGLKKRVELKMYCIKYIHKHFENKI